MSDFFIGLVMGAMICYLYMEHYHIPKDVEESKKSKNFLDDEA